MILSDKLIKEIGRSVFFPYDETKVQPASYDLSIKYSTSIAPGEFLLATTKETVKIPDWLAGEVKGKSSIARLGLMVECAGFIDPGFEGEITLELKNLSDKPIHIPENQSICQIVLEEITGHAENSYCGHYQYQEDPTPSYLEIDWGIK